MACLSETNAARSLQFSLDTVLFYTDSNPTDSIVRLVLLEEVAKLCVARIVSPLAIGELCPPGLERKDAGRSAPLLHTV